MTITKKKKKKKVIKYQFTFGSASRLSRLSAHVAQRHFALRRTLLGRGNARLQRRLMRCTRQRSTKHENGRWLHVWVCVCVTTIELDRCWLPSVAACCSARRRSVSRANATAELALAAASACALTSALVCFNNIENKRQKNTFFLEKKVKLIIFFTLVLFPNVEHVLFDV